MAFQREQFTFYASFARAIKRIKKAADRCAAYDAIIDYALYENEPELDKLPDAAAIAFELIRPNLDNGRKKAASGQLGGAVKQSSPELEAKPKQEGSKPEAKPEQPANKYKYKYKKEIKYENDSSDDDGFEEFWSAYPRKSGDIKQACFEYLGAIQSGVDKKTILDAVKWQTEDKGARYMPSAEKWLRNKGWLEVRTEKPINRNEPAKCTGYEPVTKEYLEYLENLEI